MSKAFTKEDVDPPERSGRVRSSAGLPPGAINYITAAGARRLKSELATLRRMSANEAERVAELERILLSVTIVGAIDAPAQSVVFGALVTLQAADGREETYRIVGVDELDFEPEAVSWISPLGKALLAAELGQRLTLEDGRVVKIVKIVPPTD
ncbi:MAG: GreA/GreB family elongation factor [Chthoniobacterales bacterium]